MNRKLITLPKGKHRPKTVKRKNRSVFFCQRHSSVQKLPETTMPGSISENISIVVSEEEPVTETQEKVVESNSPVHIAEPAESYEMIEPIKKAKPVDMSEEESTVETRTIVALIAYMIGVRNSNLKLHYEDCSKTFDKLKEIKEAKIIRYLCKMRTALIRKYSRVDHELRFDMKNLDRQEYFDTRNIQELEALGVPVLEVNYTAEKYMMKICSLIALHIDDCMKLFPEWVKWDYIRDLFILPKYNQPKVIAKEINLYRTQYNNYPFHNYIHWNPQEDSGLILTYDRKFLAVIYAQHGDRFSEFAKLRDAAERTKNNIYDFIDNASRVAIAVDCENSDPFKLYSVIKGLDEAETAKISKISLYDDANTTPAWDILGKYLHIPVEHIEIKRIVGHKSLVDIKMAVSISRDYYENGITSFLLFSSDSDFWGLMSSMPQMKFLVMYEYDKCGAAILATMREQNIPYNAMDDFCAAAAGDLKKLVLLQELETRLPHLLGKKPADVAYEVYAATKIAGTKQEIENFCEKYIKTLKLQVGSDGTLELAIRK